MDSPRFLFEIDCQVGTVPALQVGHQEVGSEIELVIADGRAIDIDDVEEVIDDFA